MSSALGPCTVESSSQTVHWFCCSAAGPLLLELNDDLCLQQLAPDSGRAQAQGGALVAATAHTSFRAIMFSDTALSSGICIE